MYIQLEWTGGSTINSAHTVDSGDISGIFNGVTNLYVANRTPTTLDITSDTGVDATIPVATTSLAGLASAAHITKLDSLTAGSTANSSDAYLLDRSHHTGTQTASTVSDFASVARTSVVDNSIGSGITNKASSQDAVFNALFNKVDKVGGKGLSSEDFTNSEKTKLSTVATGSTANDTDVNLKARANHTGTQLSSTISDFNTAVDARVTSGVSSKENTIVAGTTSQYYRGDKSWQTLDKSVVGLSNIDNTSDASKPVSSAVTTALSGKEGAITVGSTSQYWRGDKSWQTLDKTSVGLGNVDNTSDSSKNSATATLANKTISGSSNTLSNIPQSAVTNLTTDLAGKFATPTGNTSQVVLGNGTLGTLPVVAGLRKVETFLGTTDSSGNYTITFANTYASAPDVQPQVIGGSFIQFVRVVSVSQTGAVVQAAQRNTVNLLSTELLLGTTVALVGASVSVLVTPRS